MKIITISREFGSGGRELGKRLADLTGFDYYDSEIIARVAQNMSLDENYVERTLRDHGWQDQPITFRSTLSSTGYLNASRVQMLLEQRKVIEGIAALGKDCIIVGRNADTILAKHDPFTVFVCASRDAKVRRCMERAPEGENLTEKELIRKMKQIDRVRIQTREIIGGPEWGDRLGYELTVNTTGWDIRDLAPAVAEYAARWFGRNA